MDKMKIQKRHVDIDWLWVPTFQKVLYDLIVSPLRVTSALNADRGRRRPLFGVLAVDNDSDTQPLPIPERTEQR